MSNLTPCRNVAEYKIKEEGFCLIRWTQLLHLPNSFNSDKIVCHVCIHSIFEYDLIADLASKTILEDFLSAWLDATNRPKECARFHGKHVHKARKNAAKAREKENTREWEDSSE